MVGMDIDNFILRDYSIARPGSQKINKNSSDGSIHEVDLHPLLQFPQALYLLPVEPILLPQSLVFLLYLAALERQVIHCLVYCL